MSSVSANPKLKPAQRWLALFCALSIWAIGLLAVSPQLHASFHSDASHAEHECAVTLFSHGVDDSFGSASLNVAPQLFVSSQSLIQPASPVAEVLHRLPPGRGPPLC